MTESEPHRMSRSDWLNRLNAWGVRPARSKGQNFLLDRDIVARIADASAISPGDLVIEIGPGTGILSAELLERGVRLVAIELDDRIAPKLERQFQIWDNFKLVHANAATVDPVDLTNHEPYVIVANLPYSVATLIIRHFLESSHPPKQLTVMVQKEVAERMAAGAGDLSLLTLATQVFTKPRVLFDVPVEAFSPSPKVTSSVIQLDVRVAPLLNEDARNRMFSIATIAFQQRRKTMVNSLARGLSLEKDILMEELTRLGIDPAARPQALSLESWLDLASSPELHR